MCQCCMSIRHSEMPSTLKSGWLLLTTCFQAQNLSRSGWLLPNTWIVSLPSVYFPLMFRLWYEICVVWHIFPSDVLIKVFAPSDALFLICFPSPYSKRWLVGCTWDETFQNMIEWVRSHSHQSGPLAKPYFYICFESFRTTLPCMKGT